MSTINKLGAQEALSASDLMAMFDSSHGDARQITLTQLVAYLSDGVNISIGRAFFTKQRETPTATGWSYDIRDTGENFWLTVEPNASYASGTIVLPANPINNQMILWRVTQPVTSLTLDRNGRSGWSGPGQITTAWTNIVYRMKFNLTTDSWYWA